MIILTYDITDNKKRYKFSKFISKYGTKIQYSVYRIRNSKRIMDNILKEIDEIYKKQFDKTDSVYIFYICDACKNKVIKYGSSTYEDCDIIML